MVGGNMNYYFKELNHYSTDCFGYVYNCLEKSEKPVSFSKIYTDVKLNYPDVSKKYLYKILYKLLVEQSRIKRFDYHDKEEEYLLLSDNEQGCSCIKNFDSYQQIQKENTKILLISDTHFGREGIANYELISNIFDLAISNNISRCWHLGDFFDKSICNLPQEEFYNKILEILKLFPNNDELLTYNFLGNHDILVNRKLSNQFRHLKDVTAFNSSLRMFSKDNFVISINDLNIHFSHKLFINSFYPNFYLKNENDILLPNKRNNCFCDDYFYNLPASYDLYLFAHFHESFWGTDPNGRLFLCVPSASDYNFEKVGYILNISLDKSIILTDVLREGNKVFLGDSYDLNCSNRHVRGR